MATTAAADAAPHEGGKGGEEEETVLAAGSAPLDQQAPRPSSPVVDDDDLDHDEEEEEEDDEGSLHSRDSEYTYETVSDDEDLEGEGKKKGKGGGWFGFFRRKRDDGDAEDEEEEVSDDDEDEATDDEGDGEGEDDEGEVKEGEKVQIEADPVPPSSPAPSDSSDDRPLHPLLAPSPSPAKMSLSPNESGAEVAGKDDEEAEMAEAIERVRRRIESNGGNLYGALDPEDRKLVDELRGETDPKVIQEAVARREDGGGGGDGGEASGKGAVGPMSELGEETQAQRPGERGGAPEADTDAGDVGDAEGDGNEGGDDEEEDDDEEEEGEPTLSERRSLLSLAAEHDRVDVLRELLGEGTGEEDVTLRETLLAGRCDGELSAVCFPPRSMLLQV